MTETKYYTLTRNYKTRQMVDYYEPIQCIDGLYTVRIIYTDGTEDIEQGSLEYFNSKFEITEVKILNKGFDNARTTI